ncbi:MAG: DUF4367 domain-containing protein [Ruminococcaceae bacterium]|nr:DUF4367 domain-containing protein [Oscillospiraceae bacterium]
MAENKKSKPKKAEAGSNIISYKQHADEAADKIESYWQNADEYSYNPEETECLLAEIENEFPLSMPIDTEASLRKFKQKHAEQFTDTRQKSPKRRGIKAAIALAAVLATTFFGMIAVQGFGYDIFGAIGRWTNETFRYVPKQTEKAETPLPIPAEKIEEEFASMQEALDKYKITAPIFPKYIPEGYTQKRVFASSVPTMRTIGVTFFLGEKLLAVTIHQHEKSEQMGYTIFEKDERDMIIYEAGGIPHYIMHNNKFLTATWIAGDRLMCDIGGAISVEEMKKIIDSIYER